MGYLKKVIKKEKRKIPFNIKVKARLSKGKKELREGEKENRSVCWKRN